jgi:hypothetical protein
MANITLTEVGDSLATIIAAQALGYLKANTVLARLVARNWENLVAQRGQKVRIPFTGSLTVNDKAANTAVLRQTPNDTFVEVTLNKHKEITFLIEDVARALSSVDYLNAYLADGLLVMGEQIDSDLAALYSGFSQTIDASGANGPLDKNDFREARRLLNAAKAPQSDRFAVLHEDAESDYLNIAEAINRDYAESLGQARAEGSSGRFYGFDVFMDQKIAVATGICKNLFFQRNAMVLVTRPLDSAGDGMGVVQKVMEEDGVGIRVTLGYDKDQLGIQCTIDTLYGVAELRDSHGIVVSTTEK